MRAVKRQGEKEPRCQYCNNQSSDSTADCEQDASKNWAVVREIALTALACKARLKSP